jgi:CheY-like chemotaxis protein
MDKASDKKILVVDDEPSVRLLLREILSKHYIVFEAHNGKEAINITNTQIPDLILMDMMMPEMDGLTACHTIKTNEITKGIPVVMVTAVDYELNKKISLEILGADAYITKPFNMPELLKIIKKILSPKV